MPPTPQNIEKTPARAWQNAQVAMEPAAAASPYLSMTKVFVFGTLKRGFPLHARGLSGARYLGRYRTVAPYPMVIAGPWFAPMMFDMPSVGKQVIGELYDVDAHRLGVLDRLESIGKPGNLRNSIAVAPVDAGEPVDAVAYMKAMELATPVHSEYLAEYRDDRFIPPWER